MGVRMPALIRLAILFAGATGQVAGVVEHRVMDREDGDPVVGIPQGRA